MSTKENVVSVSGAVRELFEAITPVDGSEGDLHAAAMLAPIAYEQIWHLRESILKEVEEGLLGEEAVEAAALSLLRSGWGAFVPETVNTAADLRAALEAALDTLDLADPKEEGDK